MAPFTSLWSLCHANGRDIVCEHEHAKWHTPNWFSLRFHCAGAEGNFVDKNNYALALGTGVFQILVILVILVQSALVFLPIISGESNEGTEELRVRKAQVCVHVAFIALATSTFMLVKAVGKSRSFGRVFSVEWINVVSNMVLLALLPLADKYYLAKMLGAVPDIWPEPHGTHSDSHFLLLISICITVTHFLIPIRWCVLLVLQLWAPIVYVVYAYGVGSSELGQAHFNVICLFFLVSVSSAGKRISERIQRTAFGEVATERRLRVEAQFQLGQISNTAVKVSPTRCGTREQGHEHGCEHNHRHNEDGRSSLPSTTPTDRVFEIDPTCDPGEQLSQMVTLGLQEKWLLNCELLRLDPNRVLGSGAYGMVIGGLYGSTVVAAKIPISREGRPISGRELKVFANELRILRRLRHPNVVTFFGAVLVGESPAKTARLRPISADRFALLLEYVNGVPLDNYISSNDCEPTPVERFVICLGLSRAFVYLHSLTPRVVHGDVKPSNVMVELLGGSPRAKLVDFGLSRKLTRHTRPLGGTPVWMAPEVVRGGPASAAADIFSLGRMLYFCTTGKRPFIGLPKKVVVGIVKSGDVPPQQWPQERELTGCCQPISDRCIAAVPQDRPEAHDVLDHLGRWSFEKGWLDNTSPTSPGKTTWEIRYHDTVDFYTAVEAASMAHHRKEKSREGRKDAKGTNNKARPSIANEDSQRMQTIHEMSAEIFMPDLPICCVRNLPPTEMDTRRMALLMVAMRWNVETRKDACCSFHVTMDAVSATAENLRAGPCSGEFLPPGLTYQQCGGCTLISDGDDGEKVTCDFCGNDGMKTSTGTGCSKDAKKSASIGSVSTTALTSKVTL